MIERPADDEEHSVEISIRVDLRTAEWLAAVADLCHAPPAVVAGAMLRDICEDDQEHHDEVPASAPSVKLH